ncbi:hypothetical protein [Shouchella patagoniensis]|uniref:hypothetical protein n=1 Tax=Shouchella patagoniensis TaxID=228576 RepID=UPI000995C13F|nr:hypothetical protein [Shouchella patagoniensis]
MNTLFRWVFTIIAFLLLSYGLYFMYIHPIEQYGFRGFRFFLILLHVSIFLYGIDLIRNHAV